MVINHYRTHSYLHSRDTESHSVRYRPPTQVAKAKFSLAQSAKFAVPHLFMPITLSVIDYLSTHRARISLLPLHFRGVLVGIFGGSAPLGSCSPYLILQQMYDSVSNIFHATPCKTRTLFRPVLFNPRPISPEEVEIEELSALLFSLFTHYRLLIEMKIISKNLSALLTFKRKTSLKKAKFILRLYCHSSKYFTPI